METPLLILFLVVNSTLGLTGSFEPCSEKEGCKNATVYLGPKFGTRTIFFPSYPKLRGPNPAEFKKFNVTNSSREVNEIPKKVRVEVGSVDDDFFKSIYDRNYPVVQHRPIPEDGSFRIASPTYRPRGPFGSQSYSPPPTNDPWGRWRFSKPTTTSTSRPWRQIYYNQPTTTWKDLLGQDVLNLSGRLYSGSDLKVTLDRMDQTALWRLRRLIVDRNSIRDLLKLTFPVQLEYGLRELSLNDNRLEPSYLSGEAQFEISRLHSLQVLRLARMGLTSIEIPYLPQLEVLDLSGNRLHYLPPSLTRLSLLRELHVRDNLLYDLKSDPISQLSNLRVLDLAGNGIRRMWGNPLDSLRWLNYLNLINNSLEEVPKLPGFPQSSRPPVTTVYLSGNPWTCSCPFVEFFTDGTLYVADRHNVTCLDGESLNRYQRMAKYLTSDDVHIDCPLPVKKEFQITDVWQTVDRFFYRNSDLVYTILKVVGYGLIIITLVLVLMKKWKVEKKKTVEDVPYDVLDDKQISYNILDDKFFHR